SASAGNSSRPTRRSMPSTPRTAWAIGGRSKAPESMKRVRISLRTKLALVALVLLALPWAGALYVNEVERFLLEGQEQTLLATARAVATALHERPHLLRPEREDAEVAAILAGVQRSSSRIWVVNRDLRVISRAGTLKRVDDAAAEAPWWQPL